MEGFLLTLNPSRLATMVSFSCIFLALTIAASDATSPCVHLGLDLPAVRSQLTAVQTGIDPHVLDLALRSYERAVSQGHVRKRILTVIDYRRPSTERRLWVLDLETSRILFHELVAHGKNTGGLMATAFSNRMGSAQSSLGVFVTGETYSGDHGYSLRLEGLEDGVNDRAAERLIVVHGAWYVSSRFVRENGRLGRSYGCPALDRRVSRRVIDAIKEGSVVFAYHDDTRWIASSEFLN